MTMGVNPHVNEIRKENTMTVESKKAAGNLSAEAKSGLAKIDGMIKGVIKGYGTVQNLVHETALAIVQHAKEHGDCSRAKMLARAVPARERNSLVGWFTLFSPIGVQMGGSAADDKVKLLSDTAVEKFRHRQKMEEARHFPIWAIDQAKEYPWFTDPSGLNPEPKPLQPAGFFWDAIQKMIEREIKNAQKDGDDAKYRPEDRERVVQQGTEFLALTRKFIGATMAKDEILTDPANAAKVDENASDLPVDRVAA